MGTLIEEIFSRKAGSAVKAGEILLLDVDYIMSHDNTTPLAIKAFRDPAPWAKGQRLLYVRLTWETLTGRRLKSGAPYMNLTERARVILTDSGKVVMQNANYGQPPAAQ